MRDTKITGGRRTYCVNTHLIVEDHSLMTLGDPVIELGHELCVGRVKAGALSSGEAADVALLDVFILAGPTFLADGDNIHIADTAYPPMRDLAETDLN